MVVILHSCTASIDCYCTSCMGLWLDCCRWGLVMQNGQPSWQQCSSWQSLSTTSSPWPQAAVVAAVHVLQMQWQVTPRWYRDLLQAMAAAAAKAAAVVPAMAAVVAAAAARLLLTCLLSCLTFLASCSWNLWRAQSCLTAPMPWTR